MTQQVLIVDGPARGELVDYDGHSGAVVVVCHEGLSAAAPYDSVVYTQVAYRVREFAAFNRTLLVGVSEPDPDEKGLIDLILSEKAARAIVPGKRYPQEPVLTSARLAGGPLDGERRDFNDRPKLVDVMPRFEVQAERIAKGDITLPRSARYERTGVELADGTVVYRYAPEADPLRGPR